MVWCVIRNCVFELGVAVCDGFVSLSERILSAIGTVGTFRGFDGRKDSESTSMQTNRLRVLGGRKSQGIPKKHERYRAGKSGCGSIGVILKSAFRSSRPTVVCVVLFMARRYQLCSARHSLKLV
jgi:hypothetical protein